MYVSPNDVKKTFKIIDLNFSFLRALTKCLFFYKNAFN